MVSVEVLIIGQNRPGYSFYNAMVRQFKRLIFGASSTYVLRTRIKCILVEILSRYINVTPFSLLADSRQEYPKRRASFLFVTPPLSRKIAVRSATHYTMSNLFAVPSSRTIQEWQRAQSEHLCEVSCALDRRPYSTSNYHVSMACLSTRDRNFLSFYRLFIQMQSILR